MPATLLRLMGESDIIDIDPGQQGQDVHPRLMGLDESDRINLLGHWLDHDQGMAMSDDPDTMSAIISIAAGFLSASGSVPGWGSEVNFVVMTILRERWPVGSKSTYRTVAERVGATHTYVAELCAPARLLGYLQLAQASDSFKSLSICELDWNIWGRYWNTNQLYSILIQSPLSSSTWAEIYRNFVHPAGWYFQGQLEAVGLADVMEDSMPLSIEDTDVDPDIIGTAQMSLLGSPTIMTSLFDSAGNTVRSYIDHSAKLSAYNSLSLDSAQKLGYNKISKIIDPTSPTFDIDSDGSNAFGGIDFSNTFETLDQNIFKYDSV